MQEYKYIPCISSAVKGALSFARKPMLSVRSVMTRAALPMSPSEREEDVILRSVGLRCLFLLGGMMMVIMVHVDVVATMNNDDGACKCI